MIKKKEGKWFSQLRLRKLKKEAILGDNDENQRFEWVQQRMIEKIDEWEKFKEEKD